MAKPRLPRRRMPPPTKRFVDRKKQASRQACRGCNEEHIDLSGSRSVMFCPECERYGYEWDGRCKLFICRYASCGHVASKATTPAETWAQLEMSEETKESLKDWIIDEYRFANDPDA